MRLAQTALILSAILVGAPELQAQTAHTNVGDGCACQSCQQGCSCETCSDCGILPGLTARLGNCFGGLFGGHVGGDGRHGVYKAALMRNSFDKKIQLPVAYYRHIFPMYRHNRCCCGPVTPSAHCPTCGPHEVMGEEIIEMQEVPSAMPMVPTPAAHTRQPIVPGAVVPPKSNYKDRTAARTGDMKRTNSEPTLRKFAPIISRTESRDTTIRQVSAVQGQSQAKSVNPLR